MDARAKSDRLPLNRRVRLVTASVQSDQANVASTDRQIKKVQAQCLLKGKRLRGAEKRANCRLNKQVTDSTAEVSGLVKCNTRLRVRVRIVAQSPGESRTVWRRYWRGQRPPRVACVSNGLG